MPRNLPPAPKLHTTVLTPTTLHQLPLLLHPPTLITIPL